MQALRLEEPAAVGRGDVEVEGAAVAIDGQRHRHAGFAARPDAAEEPGQLVDRRAVDRQHDVAALQVGALRRPAGGEADDDDPVLDRGGVKPEPGPWRAVWPA